MTDPFHRTETSKSPSSTFTQLAIGLMRYFIPRNSQEMPYYNHRREAIVFMSIL